MVAKETPAVIDRTEAEDTGTAFFHVHQVARVSEALCELGRRRFDALLLELDLPDGQGLEVVERIRRQNSSVPIIVLTDRHDGQIALRALDRGAQDYLVKDQVSREEVNRAIRYAIRRQHSVQEFTTAKELLERKNRRLAELYQTAQQCVDNVSHEFRTPLTVIKEYVSLLSDGVVGPLSDKQCHFLDVVNDRADDLSHMVDDMLDLSKLDSGLLGAWRKNTELDTIVAHVRPALDRKALVREVSLDFDLPPALPEIYCDPEKVGRIIVNLAANAIKFCREPGKVRIEARHDESANDVVVDITDNGPGIDTDDQVAIFDRFRQLGPADHQSRGFGLGLSIAQQLVKLNLGEIRVESELDQGTTMSFTIPIADPVEITRRYLRQALASGDTGRDLCLVQARVDTDTGPEAADDVDRFLNYLLRIQDLLLRRDQCTWLYMLPTPQIELGAFLARAARSHFESNRNRPCGPLPDIQYEPQGSWRIGDEVHGVLDHVCAMFDAAPSVGV